MAPVSRFRIIRQSSSGSRRRGATVGRARMSATLDFMGDRIDISGLRAVTIVGALPHEREIPQPLQIDLSLEVDLRDAGRTDELGDTVHYGLVADRVIGLGRRT